MAPILTPEDVVRRIAAECACVDERGGVGIRLEPAARDRAAVRQVEGARSQRATMVDSIYHESILFPNNSCVSSWQDG
jgi:hypothetical protein